MSDAMEPGAMGVAHLLSQSSGIGLLPLVLLVLMSVGSCYYLLLKSWTGWRERRQGHQFLRRFWQSRHLQQLEQQLLQHPPREAYGRLAAAAFGARAQLGRRDGELGLLILGSADEFLLRALRQAISRERLRLEAGLTFLASVGSAAPFVGLFGTVWGIMNSFIGIAQTQTTNLAVVAPGIAEALLATAIGLFAAIPAVVIYNIFARMIGSYKASLGDVAAQVLLLQSRDLDLSASGVKPVRTAQKLRVG